MDGHRGLNLMYLDTFDGLGLSRFQLKVSPHPFYRVVPGKAVHPPWVDLFARHFQRCEQLLHRDAHL
jgi:hypothetical protein